MTNAKLEEDKLLQEICHKHDIAPNYLKELFALEKEYADKNMSKRRGIYERMSNIILNWVDEEEERRAIL